MKYEKADCPRCDTRNECFLSDEADRHLRRCPTCGHWYVLETRREQPGEVTDLQIEPLGDPPECPVGGCQETIPGDRLPEHVIESHDGSIEKAANGSI